MLDGKFTIVFAPITQDKKGQLLNTNADTVAQEIAKSLSEPYETILIYSFERKGVMLDLNDENSLIPSITTESFLKLKKEGKVFAGMIPKIENAIQAIQAGVKKVIIGDAAELDELIQGRTGTFISS